MKVNVVSLSSDKKSSQELNDEIYGLDPRSDILHRVVTWQLAKRRSGTHKTKERGEIKGSTKKIMNQKGSGGARHRTRKPNIFRGGGVVFGPRPRDYSTKLPKKIRSLGLKHALSAKAKEGALVILDKATASGKTSELAKQVKDLGWKRALVIDGTEVNDDFAQAARNIEGLDILPTIGANVYDILKRDTLVLTKAGVEALEARLK